MDTFTSRLKAAASAAASAATAAASAAASAATHLAAAASSTNALRHWRIDTDAPPAASSGPWSLYDGTPRAGGGPSVTVWVLSKGALGGEGSSPQGAPNPALATARRGVSTLARLRHPALLRVVGPLEETRSQLIWVSEAVAMTGDDVLAGAASASASSSSFSPLEVKAGCLSLADGLTFLHTAAGLVHRSVGPPALAITAKGQWKLCGLGLCIPVGGGVGGSGDAPTTSTPALPPAPREFDWHAAGPAGAVCRPDAAYSAPEVVAGGGVVGPPADVFSLALLTHDLLCPGAPALGRGRVSGGDPAGHASAVAALTGTPAGLAGIPPDAAAALRPALAPYPASRPLLPTWSAATPWFVADGALTTLRALDATVSGVAGGTAATAAVLMDVATHLPAFDTRLRTLRLLPPLLAAAGADPALQAQALPLILTIAEAQAAPDFATTTLPALKPLCACATGAGLAALARALPHLAAKCGAPSEVVSILLPLATRALDGGGVGAPADAAGDPAVKAAAAQPADPRAQEDVLRAAGGLASAGGPSAEAALLPRAHAAALRTTSAGVRAAALGALGDMCLRAPRPAAVAALDTLRRVAAVDGSPSTVGAAMALSRALTNQWGPDLAAAAALPALCPLLASRALPPDAFEAVLTEIRGMLAMVETAHRGKGGGGGGMVGTAAAARAVPPVVAPPPPPMVAAPPPPPRQPRPAALPPPPLPPPPPSKPPPPPQNDLFAGLATATVPVTARPVGGWEDLLSSSSSGPAAPSKPNTTGRPVPGGDAFASLLSGPPPPAPAPAPPRPQQPESLI